MTTAWKLTLAILILFSGTAFSQRNPTDSQTDQASDSKLVSAFKQALAKDKKYKTNDLLTWERVEPVFAELRKDKVKLPEEADLQKRFLSEKDRLVKMLGTRKGKVFFKNLAKTPEAIDRLDRYRDIPQGYGTVEQLINDPEGGGYKFFVYLADAKQGRETGKFIAGYPKGKDFDKPTGRVYVESQLIDFLKELETENSSEGREKSEKD